MKYLLDTHTLIWALQDNPMLTENVRNIIIDESNSIYVSVASIWEIAIKSRKSTNLPFTAEEIVDYCVKAGYLFLSIGLEPIVNLEKMQSLNKENVNNDPFDNILVSQSIINNMIFLTHDSKMKFYNLPSIQLF